MLQCLNGQLSSLSDFLTIKLKGMASDFLLIVNEKKEIIFEKEYDTDTPSPLAFLVAYASIWEFEEQYEDLVIWTHLCSQGCKCVFVTNRFNHSYVRLINKFLSKIEDLLDGHLLNPCYTQDDFITDRIFEDQVKELYIDLYSVSSENYHLSGEE